ncbi:chitin-binding protein [Francisella sp. SYW-9]|uniref:chitin-binding protein n=1 Tax=Francisella sp. SYW-9 TaxID=2610888 RepID=UPI001CD0B745|nr:chitin-binding protein [Francisella sp. SYW-9]
MASSWERVRDHDGGTPTPNDRFPINMNTFTISEEGVRTGDRVVLETSKDGVLTSYDLVTVSNGMTRTDLIRQVTTKINEISSQELGGNIIAGVKDANGNVVPNNEMVSIYQVASKPYADVSFQYIQGNNHVQNQLHLMDFKDQYDLNSNGSVNITAKIMSHGSDKANVHVVLQDSSGKAVYQNYDIQISPMDTYNLSLTADNLKPGDYDLIISSLIDGADIWQKDMKIKLIDPNAGNGGGDTANLDNVAVKLVSNTPYYVVGPNDSLRPAYRHKVLPPLGMHPGKQVTILPWSKATSSHGNNKSDYVKCPLPSGDAKAVVYKVGGDMYNLTCKIKEVKK